MRDGTGSCSFFAHLLVEVSVSFIERHREQQRKEKAEDACMGGAGQRRSANKNRLMVDSHTQLSTTQDSLESSR